MQPLKVEHRFLDIESFAPTEINGIMLLIGRDYT